MIHRAAFAFLLLALLTPRISAQSAAMRQALLDLSCNGVMMNVSAHPDDEDGASLAMYRMKYGVKTYSVLFTRGEGGQNEKGPELYEELGVLRSAETMSAGSILGTEVHFLNLKDFGFSKTATEAFQKWGGEREVLRRLVYAIRKYKPDVIFTNHNTIDGHGHHQAVAITAITAFDVAADSTFFPEQLSVSGLALWQPKKLFFRQFGKPDMAYDVANAIEEVRSDGGMAYLDIASGALRQHRTQGLERADLRAFTRGKSQYKLIRSNSLYERDTTTFFGGMDLWRDPSLLPLALLRSDISRFTVTMPRDSVFRLASKLFPRLRKARHELRASPLASRIVARWEEALERLNEAAAGIRSEFRFLDPVVVAKQTVRAVLSVSADSAVLGSFRATIIVPEGWSANEDPASAPAFDARHAERTFTVTVGDAPVRTIPKEIEQYASLDGPPAVLALCDFTLDGAPLSETVAARFDVAPPQQLRVVPGIVRIDPKFAQKGLTLQWSVTNRFPRKSSGRISVDVPAGWRGESYAYAIEKEDSTVNGDLHVFAPAGLAPGDYTLLVKSDYWSQQVIVRAFEVAVPEKISVGIVRSYDTTLEEATKELGIRVVLLSDEDLATRDLAEFSSIIVDIRAYLVRDGLRKNNQRLLDYARGGGNLVVTYQREQEWKPDYAPYPFQITRKRVTVEEAPVTTPFPGHPLLRKPNVIDDAAWEDWKQERAVYMPGDVPAQYQRLLASHDPDEEPLTTGLLVAQWGKGSYIYTSYVWYRQLKDQHPGALRMLMNMIAYPLYRTVTP